MPGEKTHSELPLMLGLLMVNVLWGASFIANAIALKSIGPIEIVSLRFFITAPLLFGITLLWKGPGIFRIDLKDLLPLTGMAITGVTLQYILQVTAQSYTSAINVSLLINTSTFFILFLGALVLGERLTSARVIGAFIGFAGVALLVSRGTLSFSLGQFGDLMVLLCAFLWAVYTIISKRISGKYSPLTVLNYVFIIGTIGFIPFYLLSPQTAITTIPLQVTGAILFLAIFCSIIAYLIYNIALDRMGASRVALYIYFVPLSTIILAWLILGESLTLAAGIGGLFVLAGMWIAERKTT
jgi:drug/metabolite transporter (DMT)-like permease